MTRLFRVAPFALAVLAALAVAPAARAQSEYPPAAAKAPLVIVISGHSGASNYIGAATAVAKLGYDAVLLDANEMRGEHGATLKAAIEQARQSPHAAPGKVAVVGFSQGGGQALAWATQWPELVAVVVGWYPETSFVHDPAGFVGRMKVPALVLAGEADTYHNCCLIATARALGAAAAGKAIPLELVTYPDAEHDYLLPGRHYSGQATGDSWQRTAAKLKQYLGK